MTDQNALLEALANLKGPIEEQLLIFHPGCGGIVTGTGEFRCEECGEVFTLKELPNLIG